MTLTGPVAGPHASFAVALEHRSIDEVSAVNAIVPGTSATPVHVTYTASTPQSLWQANARIDFQWTPRSLLNAVYQANVASLRNQGVGGNALQEAGWTASPYDHAFRLSNVTTVSPTLVHETRSSIERIGEGDSPNSSLPQQEVGGFFTGGGASVGSRRTSAWVHEFDDDIMVSTPRHFLKFGVQGLYNFVRNTELEGFNGSYLYSGYVNASGTAVSALSQYQDAQRGAALATQYTNVSGTPKLSFFQAQQALFLEDSYRADSRWTVSYGVRYAFETNAFRVQGVGPKGVGLSSVPTPMVTVPIHESGRPQRTHGERNALPWWWRQAGIRTWGRNPSPLRDSVGVTPTSPFNKPQKRLDLHLLILPSQPVRQRRRMDALTHGPATRLSECLSIRWIFLMLFFSRS